MKKSILALTLALTLSVVLFYSCKKDSKSTTGTQLDSQTQQFNTDQNNIKAESDQSDDDINTSIAGSPTMNGRSEATYNNFVCGVSIDSSSFSTGGKYMVFQFDGKSSCLIPSRIRSGKIRVELTHGSRWGEQGAILTITYEDYKVLYQASGVSLTFNGTKTLTNVNGNDWLGFLFSGKSLEYKERAYGIKVTFNDGSTATWNTAHTTDWTYNGATANLPIKVVFSTKGDTTLNGFTSVNAWGATRFGTAFTTQYSSPIVSNTYCGLWRFISGVFVDHINGADYTLTVGVNTDGTPVTNTDDCAYGYKVSWVDANGTTQTKVFSY